MRYHILVSLLVAAMLAPSTAQAELYRWVDEDGEVHYSDRLPPDRAPEERRIFSRGGDTLRDVERMPTAAELRELEAARQAAEEETRRSQEQRQLQAEYDRMLMLSYGSVDDLQRSRERRLQPLQVQLDNALRRQARLDARIEQLRTEAADAERRQEDTGALERRLEQTRDLRQRETARIRQREQDIRAIKEEFDRHQERFTELVDNGE